VSNVVRPIPLRARALHDFNRHHTQFLEYPAAPAHRPPFIQIGLHRFPHRDPARDGEAFPDIARPRRRIASNKQLTRNETGGKEYQTNRQRHAALSHDPAELQVTEASPVGEVVMDRIRDQRSWIVGGPFLQMDTKCQWCIERLFMGPVHDILVGVTVEIALVEWGRVH
jgi:hypothetical protein